MDSTHDNTPTINRSRSNADNIDHSAAGYEPPELFEQEKIDAGTTNSGSKTNSAVQMQSSDQAETSKKTRPSPEDNWNNHGKNPLSVAKHLYKIMDTDEVQIIEMVDYLTWHRITFTGHLIDWIPTDNTLQGQSIELLKALLKGMQFSISSEDQVRKGRVQLAISKKIGDFVEDTMDDIADTIDKGNFKEAVENLEKQETVLTGDVGRGKTNNAEDVNYVKNKLFALGVITEKERDSGDENVLHAIIVRYQEMTDSKSIDGVVSKNGTSIQYLMSNIKGYAHEDKHRLRVIKEDEKIQDELALEEVEVTNKAITDLINSANGNMTTLAERTVSYLRANSKMVEEVIAHVKENQKEDLVRNICSLASEAALMSANTDLLDTMYAILDNGWTTEQEYMLMAKIQNVQRDPISRWLNKQPDKSTTPKKNSSIADLVLEAEELNLIYFNPEGTGNFDSGFGGCKDTFLKFKKLEIIGNGEAGTDTFDPKTTEAPILELTLNVIKDNVRDWIKNGKKSKPNLITLGSFMVWNTGERAGRLRTTNHGGRAKAIDINVYTSDHEKVDFTKDGAEEKVYKIIRDLPVGTYEIGLPFQGLFFPSTAAGGNYHRSKHTDNSWVYHQLKSQRLKDAFDNLLEGGAKLKVITDYNNHLHLAIGSGVGYADKDNKDDNL